MRAKGIAIAFTLPHIPSSHTSVNREPTPMPFNTPLIPQTIPPLPTLIKLANGLSFEIDLEPDEVTDYLQALQSEFDDICKLIAQTEGEDFIYSNIKCPENCCGVLVNGIDNRPKQTGLAFPSKERS
jgi:hypothetical protein